MRLISWTLQSGSEQKDTKVKNASSSLVGYKHCTNSFQMILINIHRKSSIGSTHLKDFEQEQLGKI
jgi:hypothetical protein